MVKSGGGGGQIKAGSRQLRIFWIIEQLQFRNHVSQSNFGEILSVQNTIFRCYMSKKQYSDDKNDAEIPFEKRSLKSAPNTIWQRIPVTSHQIFIQMQLCSNFQDHPIGNTIHFLKSIFSDVNLMLLDKNIATFANSTRWHSFIIIAFSSAGVPYSHTHLWVTQHPSVSFSAHISPQ